MLERRLGRVCGLAAEAAREPHRRDSPVVGREHRGTVLVDARGYTLYLLTPEKGGKIKCVDQCLEFWPPLTTTGGRTPVGGGGIDASLLGTVDRPDGGTQVTYHDYPLYRFAGDKAPGQVNGQGVEKVWFAVTPDGTAAS